MVLLDFNHIAKTKLTILAFLYCWDFVKISIETQWRQTCIHSGVKLNQPYLCSLPPLSLPSALWPIVSSCKSMLQCTCHRPSVYNGCVVFINHLCSMWYKEVQVSMCLLLEICDCVFDRHQDFCTAKDFVVKMTVLKFIYGSHQMRKCVFHMSRSHSQKVKHLNCSQITCYYDFNFC